MLIKSLSKIHVLNLGRLSYSKGLQVQKWFEAQHLSDDSASPVLLIVEHDPVYTLGLRETVDPEQAARLSALGAEVVKSDRGGLTTFHGPGQLVAYPIIHLTRWHKGLTLRNYVSLLESVAIRTCRMMGINTNLNSQSISHTGAWAGDKKICAIGVHCKRHVTTHGLALNCNVDLAWFDHIVPCGILDKGMTSVSQELGQSLSVHDVLPQFLASFESTFRCSLINYASSDSVPVQQILS